MSTPIFLFDIDGTLTPHRKLMTPEFQAFFLDFAKNHVVYLVTGSDIKKVKEQIPKKIRKKCAGVFASSANELWKGKKKVYENLYIPSKQLIKDLKQVLEDSPYTERTGLHIEHRPGMLNFSVPGRNATTEQRDAYEKWDNRHQERKQHAVKLMSRHSEIDVKVGGQISIDIYPRGLDKSQAVTYIREEDELYDPIIFFGDRCDPDGNDYSVVKALTTKDTVHPVETYRDTLKLLKDYAEKK
jgi:phosphomannomutase